MFWAENAAASSVGQRLSFDESVLRVIIHRAIPAQALKLVCPVDLISVDIDPDNVARVTHGSGVWLSKIDVGANAIGVGHVEGEDVLRDGAVGDHLVHEHLLVVVPGSVATPKSDDSILVVSQPA